MARNGLHTKKNEAFTLIEMLVVIAIIALLTSIVVPAVSRALAASRRVADLSNVRQITQATIMSSVEDEGRFPSLRNHPWDASGHIQEMSEQSVSGAPAPQAWGVALANYLSFDAVDTVNVDPDTIPSIFKSPSALQNSTLRNEYPWIFRFPHYRYNSYAAERSLDQTVSASRAMIFISAVWPGWEDEAFAHQNPEGISIAFADGSVRFLSLRDYRELSPSTDYQNPLFLNGWFQ